MPYWDLVTRSFRIAWDRKYIWLIALFAGESGGGGYSYSTNYNTRSTSPGAAPDVGSIQTQVTDWISGHVGLIVVIAVVWLLLVIGFFILGAVCQGATVRAAAEHDAERQFGLGWAWRSGVGTMWVMVRFRLLIVALGLPLFVVVAGAAVGLIFAIAAQNGTAIGLTAGIGLLALLVGIPYFVYISLLDRLGSRAVVLEQLGATKGLARGHRLLFKRLGRALLVLLLAVGVSIVVSIALACFFAILAIPLVVIGIGLATVNSTAGVAVLVISLLVLIPVALVIQGFFSAQGSIYWTLAFRRLDLDYAPAPTFQYQPPPPQPAQ